jgi:hypothetical protein
MNSTLTFLKIIHLLDEDGSGWQTAFFGFSLMPFSCQHKE